MHPPIPISCPHFLHWIFARMPHFVPHHLFCLWNYPLHFQSWHVVYYFPCIGSSFFTMLLTSWVILLGCFNLPLAFTLLSMSTWKWRFHTFLQSTFKPHLPGVVSSCQFYQIISAALFYPPSKPLWFFYFIVFSFFFFPKVIFQNIKCKVPDYYLTFSR